MYTRFGIMHVINVLNTFGLFRPCTRSWRLRGTTHTTASRGASERAAGKTKRQWVIPLISSEARQFTYTHAGPMGCTCRRANEIELTAVQKMFQRPFLGLFSTGLCNQSLHHVFPTVPVFEEHGLPMTGWTHSYWDSLQMHIDHLCAVNPLQNPTHERASRVV